MILALSYLEQIAPELELLAGTITSLGIAALGITLAYLTLFHVKQATHVAGGVENYENTLANNGDGDFCENCGVWDALDVVEANGDRCTSCGDWFFHDCHQPSAGDPHVQDEDVDLSFLDDGASGLFPHECEGCGVTILNPDATHCNECRGAGGTTASPFRMPDDLSFLDDGASGLFPHSCEGCGVTILNPDATHCNECSGAGSNESPFRMPT